MHSFAARASQSHLRIYNPHPLPTPNTMHDTTHLVSCQVSIILLVLLWHLALGNLQAGTDVTETRVAD
jgi:hypothetical protein